MLQYARASFHEGKRDMQSTGLDVTNGVRDWMARCLGSGEFSLDLVQAGLRDAAWYSMRDRRAVRALCDAHPRDLTRWLFEREGEGRYTGLLMVWPAGHSTPIHDHAGLWGIELVLQGTLVVDDYVIDPASGEPRFLRSTLLAEGESAAFEAVDGHVHRCTNPSRRCPAVTLNLYGGLLDAYRTFEDGPRPGRTTSVPARIDGCIGTLAVRAA